MSKRSPKVKKIVTAALMLALAYVLPNFTGNIPQFGKMLLPMHLPILLCGFLCGGPWGAVVGFLAPLLRSAVLSAPPMYPIAAAMAFELAAYGFVSGFAYRRLPKGPAGIYAALLAAMLGGRVVWGLVMALFALGGGPVFSLAAFAAGAFTQAIPGILLQLVAVPGILLALQRAGLAPGSVQP